MDNTNFLIGELRPPLHVGEDLVEVSETAAGGGVHGSGGYWLGREFYKSNHQKPFPV